MQIHLTPEEIEVLKAALQARLRSLQDEMAHTESFPIQKALHRDMDAIESVLGRLPQAPEASAIL